jgi:hypothetical protein
MRATRTISWIFAALAIVVALAMAGCGGDDDSDSDQTRSGPRLADQWAGTVEGSGSYISVFTLDNGQTGAYLADGKQIAVLALGTLEDGRLSLESEDGTKVAGTASGDSASGTVALDGQEHSFAAQRATGDAGWYRARATAGGEPIAAGYIVLADGSQRGAVRQGDKVIAAPQLDVSDPTIEVPGVGALSLLPVADVVIKEGGIS